MSGRPQRILRSRDRLQMLMEDRGHDTVTLAAATGLSKQVIGYLRFGPRTSCSRETAELISAALGCREETLFCKPVSSKTEERNGG